MKKTRFTEEQMVTIVREVEEQPVPKVATRHQRPDDLRAAEAFRQLEPADVKRLRQLEQEH